MNELELVHSLFDQQVRFTLGFLPSLEKEHWQIKMHLWDSMFFHRRASSVNVEEVIKHTIIAEQHIIYSIESLEDGATVSIEGNEGICEGENGKWDLVACYQKVHAENSNKIINFKQNNLSKSLMFIDQPYTGIGLLWVLIGHHAFHLGQLRSMCFPRAK